MAISPDFLDELRTRLGLADVVARHVQLKRSGREASGLCPFHNEKSPSFTVSEEKGFFHCFGCGAHGDLIGFVMRIEGLSFPEAVERLAAEAGLEVPQASPAEREAEARKADLHGVMDAACRFFEHQLAGPRGEAARRYLEHRGIDDDTASRFRLGYAPDSRTALRDAVMGATMPEAMLVEAGLLIGPDDGSAYDRFRGRVMFPITDRRGRVIAFGGRILGEGKPKYLNSPDTPLFNKGRVLYGMATARRPAHEAGRVLVAEGYTDVIALSRAGIAEAVAPLGTALSESHLHELWRMADEPILCFDGDAAGKRAAYRAAERALPLLQPGKSLQFVSLPAGEDPDSLVAKGGRAAIDDCLAGRRSLVEVVWEMSTAGQRFDTPERVAGLEQSLERLVGRIDDRKVHFQYLGNLRRRIADNFGFSHRRQRPSMSGGGSPEAVRQHGPRCVIAVLLGHPGLAEEFLEDLSELNISEERLDNLLKEILLLAKQAPGLDAPALRRQLTGVDAQEAETLLCSATYAQWPFARPESPIESARQGLTEMLERLMRPALTADLAAAELALANDPSDENWTRFQKLMETRLDADDLAELVEIDGSGGGDSNPRWGREA